MFGRDSREICSHTVPKESKKTRVATRVMENENVANVRIVISFPTSSISRFKEGVIVREVSKKFTFVT